MLVVNGCLKKKGGYMRRLIKGSKCPWGKGLSTRWRKKSYFYVATVGAYWCRCCDAYRGCEDGVVYCDT